MSKSPAFQFYPADFVIDTGILTAQQAGVYIWLLCAAWKGVQGTPQCCLPDDDQVLAAIGKVTPKEWRGMRKRILPYFRKDGDLLVHDRLLKELQKQQEWSAKSSEGGKKSAATRKGGSTTLQPPHQPKAQPKGNSSVFSSQSSSSVGLSKNPAVVDVPDQQRQQPIDDLVAYLGEEHRHDVQAVAQMPGTGTTWARGFLATWGPNGSPLEGERIPKDIRARVVGTALRRFATDRRQWSVPGFAPFVNKAHTDVLEHRAEQAKAEDAKASASHREAALEALEEKKRELEAEAAERGYVIPSDPMALVRNLSDAKAMRAQGSAT